MKSLVQTGGSLLLFALICFVLVEGCDRYRDGTVTIIPVEDTTRALQVVEKRWFGANKTSRIEVRNDEEGRAQWMMLGKDGKWHPAFNFSDHNLIDDFEQ
jgi:hypothetical protein